MGSFAGETVVTPSSLPPLWSEPRDHPEAASTLEITPSGGCDRVRGRLRTPVGGVQLSNAKSERREPQCDVNRTEHAHRPLCGNRRHPESSSGDAQNHSE